MFKTEDSEDNEQAELKDDNETENYLENIDFINNNSTNCDAFEENNSSAWDTFDDINRNSVIRYINFFLKFQQEKNKSLVRVQF